MKKIILIDNYDSFTFNLYHYLSSLKTDVEVIRNDEINANEILKKKYNVHGVQFHPESIKTKLGIKILKNFIRL